MDRKMTALNPALSGSPVRAYLHFAVPSVLALLAWSAMPIVDGLFIARHLGILPLAAVNLIMPLFSVAFGVAFMISVGGSARAGKYIGEGNHRGANDVFSKTLIIGLAYALFFVLLGMLSSDLLFRMLGAGPDLFPFMHDYFDMLLWFFPVQILAVVFYYFVRIAGFPRLAGLSIVVCSLAKLVLNTLLILVADMGLSGAALSTGISTCLMLGILLLYRFSADNWLSFELQPSGWGKMLHTAYNGFSEFIDEISAGVVTYILNLIVIGSYGEKGVAALSVVNYSLFIGLMLFYGYSEALNAVCSQCYGAGKPERMGEFLRLVLGVTLITAVLLSLLVLVWGNTFVGFFIATAEPGLIELAEDFISVLWPIFLFNGLNVIIISYLTSIQRATASALVAVLRAFVLPLGLMFLFLNFLPQIPFVAAITLGEMLAFLVSCWLLMIHRPSRLFASPDAGDIRR